MGEVKLDDEDSAPVYKIELTDASGKRQELHVDRSTGKVLANESGDD